MNRTFQGLNMRLCVSCQDTQKRLQNPHPKRNKESAILNWKDHFNPFFTIYRLRTLTNSS